MNKKAQYIIYLNNGFVKFEEINDDHADIVNLHSKYPDACQRNKTSLI